MLQAAYDSGVTVLRFPGGSWGDLIMTFASQPGAQVMISVLMLGGTPKQAAEMVWSIGNEPTRYDGVYQNRNETYDVDRFNPEWQALAEAMKQVDLTIKLVEPVINQFGYGFTPGVTTN